MDNNTLVLIRLIWLLVQIVLTAKGEDCDIECTWSPWNAWNQCTATCGGGYRTRDRPLCCNSGYDVDQCLAACRLTEDGFFETETCSGTCHNGAASVVYPNQCSCTTAYYGSCCESRISCPQPSSISNGLVTGGSTFYYGDTVAYSCNTGYNVTDGDITRTCRRDSNSGYWNGSQPRCAYAVSCESQPCQNSGTCINGLDLYTCNCDTGWSGTNCEFDIFPPVYDQCPNNITAYVAEAHITVEWLEPEFTDPHEESAVHITAQNYYEPEASLPWGEYIMQYVAIKPRNGMSTECIFSTNLYPNPCTHLNPPPNGSIACNGWNSRFGEICVLFCTETADVPPNIGIENVYVCGATGNWLPTLPADASCSERRSELSALSQTPTQQQHYYNGHCSDANSRSVIQQAYIDILMSHDMAYMCTADRFVDQCVLENVDIYCN